MQEPRRLEERRRCLSNVIFMVTNILYVSLLITVFGEEDHNRYRFTVDAFYLTLLGLLISSGIAAVKTCGFKRKLVIQVSSWGGISIHPS